MKHSSICFPFSSINSHDWSCFRRRRTTYRKTSMVRQFPLDPRSTAQGRGCLIASYSHSHAFTMIIRPSKVLVRLTYTSYTLSRHDTSTKGLTTTPPYKQTISPLAGWSRGLLRPSHADRWSLQHDCIHRRIRRNICTAACYLCCATDVMEPSGRFLQAT